MGEWPFYYVQIAPYTYTVKDKQGLAAWLREAQAKAVREIPNAGMVVTTDVGSEKGIHPPDKTTVSRRLAYWALANTYGKKGINYQSPVYKSMKITGSSVFVNFDFTPNGLTAFGKDISAFELAGEDKVFYPAKASISGNGVIVESEQVKLLLQSGMYSKIGRWEICIIRRACRSRLLERMHGDNTENKRL